MRAFKLIERSARPGCHEIQVEGEVDMAVAERLREAIDRADGHDVVLIGLEGCDFIDSTGIAVIVHAYRRVTAEGRRIALYGPTDQVHRVLSITGLVDNGLVFEDAEGALEGATRSAPGPDARPDPAGAG